MKRRDFISTSAGLVGALIPTLGFGQSKPCPPGTLNVSGGASTATSCGPSLAPAWFANMPERTWTAIAGGNGMSTDWQQGSRLADVAPVPVPGILIGGDSLKDAEAITNNWTGFVVDGDRGHLMSVASGGHWGYMGNEVYALNLKNDHPGWSRVLDPTPDKYNGKILLSNPQYGYNPFNQDLDSPQALTYGDWSGPTGDASPKPYGRMRAIHSYNTLQYANGRVWACPPSGFNGNCFALDYDGIVNGSVPKEWSLSVNPWTSFGALGGRLTWAGSSLFGTTPTVLDSKRNRLWGFARYYGVAWSVDVSYGALSQSRLAYFPDGSFKLGGVYDNSECWAVYCEDLDIIVMSLWQIDGKSTASVAVFNAASMPSDSWSVSPLNVPVFGSATTDDEGVSERRNRKGYGAVYWKAGRSILVYDPQGIAGGQIAALKIPDNPRSGTWEWSLLSPMARSVNVEPAAGWQGAFSKFNIVEDMGNGQSCLVAATRESGPTYVYKLPA